MAGLATNGFALSDLPTISPIPANVGRFSTKEANDTAESSLQLGQNLMREVARYKADQAALANQKAQADAAASTAAPLAGAQIAQANVLAQENNPDVAALKGQAASGAARNALAQTNLDAQELALLKTLTPEQYAAYKQVHGFGKVTSETTARNPNTGALTETSAAGIQVPGKEPVVVDQNTRTGAAPYALPNGMGVLIDNGKGQAAVHALPAMLNNVVGTEPQFIGTSTRPDGVQEDEYVINEYNAQGGVRPGEHFKITHGTTPPAPTGSRAFSNPRASAGAPASPAPALPGSSDQQILNAATNQAVTGKMQAELTAKNKQEALNDIAASAEQTSAMAANIEHAQQAIDQYNKDSLVPNAIRGHAGFLPSVQAVQAAKSAFVSDIMGKLKGAGRVTQQEVQYASAAYPDATQAQAVQQANLDYLRQMATTVQNRRNFEFQAVSAGVNPALAKEQAIQKFPIGVPPSPGATGAAGPVGSAGVRSFSTPAEAQAAADAGQIKAGDRISVAGQPGTWH